MELLVESVSVDVPEITIDPGLKFAVVALGSPLTSSVTVPANPLTGATLAENVVPPPAVTD